MARDEQASFMEDDQQEKPFRRTNTSAYYRSIEKKRKRYTPSAEELADDQDIRADSSSEEDEDAPRLSDKKSAPMRVDPEKKAKINEIETQLELSAMKGRHINDKI